MEQIRSFVAVELPSGIKTELSSLQVGLKRGQHPFVKWINPNNIHLTLKFLGNVSSTAMPQLIGALNGAAQGIFTFNLQLGKLGAFPDLRRPRIIWVGVEGEVEKLALLQKAIESALLPLGFQSENHSFSAHLTLGRLRERVTNEQKQDFARWTSTVKCEINKSFKVKAFKLMKSQLTPDGAIYSELASIGLQAR